MSRGIRAAKLQANKMLDAQAKDLAEYQRQMARSKSANSRPLTPRRPSGIRVSARLRGTATDNEEWQEVPEEWLAGTREKQQGEENTLPLVKARLKTGLESEEESISDLTELSEDDNTNEENTQERANADDSEEVLIEDETEMEFMLAPSKTDQKIGVDDEDGDHPAPLGDFIEWETVLIFPLAN